MTGNQFPIEKYIAALAKFLDTIDYHDENFSHEQRLESLRYVYSQTAKHFDQPVEQAALNVSSKRLQAVMRTSTLVTVYCWAKCPLDVMVGVSVYFVYIIMLDDSSEIPSAQMKTFCEDLIKGRPQKHLFWQRMNAHLTNFLRYYGGFCSITIFRSTLDFFQGCWIEQNNFGGFPGSSYFPHFLRRLNGLGGISSATLFPSSDFDEELVFKEITTAVAQIEPQLTLCNDLISFYKEYDSPRDQINLVSNIMNCNGVGWEVAFEQLTHDTILSCEQLVNVFKGKDPKVEATVRAFVQGYVTWHLCDPRFRMEEVYQQAGQSEADMKFRQFYEKATSIGVLDFKLWASPCDLNRDSIDGEKGQAFGYVFQNALTIFVKAWDQWMPAKLLHK
ncbi:Trichodiene synthase [Penicillium canariense]|uniref:Trichodiene synthase n=1 Tax=Penicillium canariense TaxID=189055 RepID=A0A9W9LKM3_9EURO|nr:Trichodiene synthase [Penicillium canariense]KAJ5160939.1 Trichodiene synthase [Penicillium canariense]